jgi:hypothetical protein
MWAAALNLMSLGGSALLLAKFGQKIFGTCIGRIGGCFVAGTQVVTAFVEDSFIEDRLDSGVSGIAVAPRRGTITKAIEDIELGSRVITEAPDVLPRESEFGQPDQATWRQVNLLQHRGDGTIIEMELIRPAWWIKLLGLEVGTVIELLFPELQTVGTAHVLSFSDCPLISEGDGRVVIGRFITRQAMNLVKVYLEDDSSFVGTSTHPVWSVNASDWKRIDELDEGEQVRTFESDLKIMSLAQVPRRADVFNIEVEGEHVYRLLNTGVLVHNARYSDIRSAVKAGANTATEFVNDVYEAMGAVFHSLKEVSGVRPKFLGVEKTGVPYGDTSAYTTWFRVEPAEPWVGNLLPHIKFKDSISGKEGHIWLSEEQYKKVLHAEDPETFEMLYRLMDDVEP